jgi:hypothetical protein
MHINIDLPEEGKLSDRLRSLPTITSPKRKAKEAPVVESDPLILSSVTKKKEKKKKEKKKKKSDLDTEFMSGGGFASTHEDDDENDGYDFSVGDNLLDVQAILAEDDDDEDDIGDPIINAQRRGYEKRKKDENPFKKEFAEELTLLYDLLDEMNKFSKDLDKQYKSMQGSKVRGMSKYTNELVTNILSSKTNKLQVLKEINSLKKTIADLKIKMDGKNGGAEGGAMNTDMLATQYFQQILRHGRGNFVQQQTGQSRQLDDEDDDGPVDELVAQIEKGKLGYNDSELADFNSLIEERLETEQNHFRSENGSKYIQYENLGVKIKVKRCIDTGEWEFIAVDRDNQIVYDYPLPNKRDVGKMKFSDTYATDERGRSYALVEYYSGDIDSLDNGDDESDYE